MSLWRAVLAVLVAARIAIPLAALAASGTKLPGIPRYDYAPLNGDANDYYAAGREVISTPLRQAPLTALLALGVALAVWWGLRLRGRRPDLAWAALAGPALALGLAVAAEIRFMHVSGAGTIGWPLVWAVPMAPLRALGALDPDSAFAAGLAVSLVANAVSVVATAYVGRYATGSRAIGLAASGLFALWPLLTGVIAGERGWENGTWQVDVGLHLYSEPLSTALVTVAAALLLAPRATDVRLWAAGGLLGFATAVRLSNALLAALALALVWKVGRERVVPFLAGAAASVPVVASYWPKGYLPRFDDPQAFPQDPFSLEYVVTSWSESLLFRPVALLVLAPLALAGVVALRRRRAALFLLGGWIAATAAFYSVYESTAQHPRFLFVVLPSLLVLEAAGASAAVRLAGAARRRGNARLRL